VTDNPADDQRLRLMVVDAEDLAVVSAHLQDAEVMLADMAYVQKTKQFALMLSRFDRPQALSGRYERCRAGLHFERVLKVARRGLDGTPGRPLQLLAISFVPDDAPSGSVLLTFVGGGQIRLTVECLEAGLRDLGPRWEVSERPGSPLDGEKASV
jgi:hypothetical protein